MAGLCGALFWIVWIYANGLRDPRYLDGWLLVGGMVAQLLFHIAVKRGGQTPKSLGRWRTFHILLGYGLIAAFLSHSDFSLPETNLEWALWTAFFVVTLSGALGTYLSWSIKTRNGIGDGLNPERIQVRREEIARDLHAAATRPSQVPDHLQLPALPYDAWILDFYANHLRTFVQTPQHLTAHVFGSQRHLKVLTDEIDILIGYVDGAGKDKLAVIRNLVVEKDRLDHAHVHLGLLKGWLYIHVPVTYALVVLTVLHGFVAYAFSSGAW
ncbi:MAG: hypothetical protein MUC37_06850 [Hyphomicrobium sp.]|jgi:hypothetical protein|nr:hypothetical protein [Hyphomicrobium sp.]